MKRSVLSLIAVLVFVSAASAKTKTAQELRSHLLAALSLASETELFIGQIEEGRILQQFRMGHADYLRQEARRNQSMSIIDCSGIGGQARAWPFCIPISVASSSETISK